MARTRMGRWASLPRRTDTVAGPATRTVVCHGVSVEDLEFWRERMTRTGKGPVTDSEIMRGTLIAFRKFFGAGDGEALSRSFGCGGSR